MKRQGAALLVVLALVASTGCVGLVFGDGVSLDAEPARVDQDSLGETEFDLAETETLRIEEPVSVLGQEREIRATNHVATYERTDELASIREQTGAFVVVSSPEFSMLGRTFNPIGDMSNRELLSEFRGELESEVGELRDVREVGERREPILGAEGDVTTFAAETDLEGETVTLNVHVATVRHEDDLIVTLGVHPEALQQQAPEIFALMRGVEHPAEE